ncbi:M20 family metallopeptidase [Brevibacillus sp. TJ4]|uniref:M20 family metallopeptidase n=1 Tax=Brevibacillus sp. TJ4 TaxID=3234853 RepID=UPI0037CF6DE0
MPDLYRYLQEQKENILLDLERVVKAESPTHDKASVDQCGAVFQSLFQKHLGLSAEVIPHAEVGNPLRFTYGEGSEQILVIGHMDTVWDIGRIGWRVEGGKAYGPGVLDMKGGIVQALWAVKACHDLGVSLGKKVVFLCTTDEELGSKKSRALIEEEARKSAVVLVPEPAAAKSGAVKTSRKGTGGFTVSITGKASHAGNHHEDGISAVQEMAHQILFLHSLTDYAKGTTLNVGVAQGGTRSNVVADHATLSIDLRVTSKEEGERITQAIMERKPHHPGITLNVTGGLNRPPMVRTAQTEQLFRLAAECAQELGFALQEEPAGGGSDGNFTSALGIPTLDGLGAVGEGPHAEYEHIQIDQLPVRAALFAKMLTRL